jgi:hypothetical protein
LDRRAGWIGLVCSVRPGGSSAAFALGTEGGGDGRATNTVNEVLDGHVALDIQCLDRILSEYSYVPRLPTSAQVVAFLTGHLGYRFSSPALFNQIGQRLRRAVAYYAEANGIPWVKFGKDADKLAVVRPHLARQARSG